jgi:peptidoglycan/xylan/chitin deacetylase (PgdA/CDA1 family)
MIGVLKRGCCAATFRTGILKSIDFGTRILCYHGISPEYFQQQMEYLKEHYEVARLQDALREPARKQVAITLDDGYRDHYRYAYPVLKKLGMKATIFLTYEFADKNLFAWWDRLESRKNRTRLRRLKQLSQDALEREVERLTLLKLTHKKDHRFDFMDWNDIRESLDVFEIGSHGLTHRILTRLSLTEAAHEIASSKKKLEEMIARPVVSFAYPDGECDEASVGLVKKAGYRCAVTMERGDSQNSDYFRLRRRGINVGDDLAVFANKVAGIL